MTALVDALGLNARMMQGSVFKYLSGEGDAGGIPTDGKKAMIACTARSGSSYLVVALRRYGLNFQEFMNTEGYVRRYADDHKPATVAGFASQLATEVREGVLGLKIPFAGLTYLLAMKEVPENLDQWSIVFLTRRNVVRQAISRHIASITQKWTATMPERRPIAESDYDFDALLRFVDSVLGENARWERFFVRVNVTPMKVIYEDIVADEDRAIADIASYLSGAPKPPMTVAVGLEKQATSLNAVWEERFMADLRKSLPARAGSMGGAS